MHADLLEAAYRLESQLMEDRRYLHAHAETGFDLMNTYAYVWARLEEMGIAPRKCGRCGIVATIGRGGKVILLRADMDALAIREETGDAFACASGSMHACGHDMHTAMLLGAARLLKEQESELPGTVMLMFQPAEELLQGAADMLAGGLLDDPKPDAAMMIHVLTGVPIPAGTLLVSAPGVSAPAASMFEITVHGKSCHGAMPHTGVDALNAAAHILLGLQTVNSREIAPAEVAALTIGVLQAGDAANVIPEKAVMRGSLRAMDEDVHQQLRKRVTEIAELTARTFRATAEVDFYSGCPTLMNDQALTALALESMQGLLGKERAMSTASMGSGSAKLSGSEDFANISRAVPSVMLALAAGEPGKGFIYPAHHAKTRYDESVLPIGAAAYAKFAADYLDGK